MQEHELMCLLELVLKFSSDHFRKHKASSSAVNEYKERGFGTLKKKKVQYSHEGK